MKISVVLPLIFYCGIIAEGKGIEPRPSNAAKEPLLERTPQEKTKGNFRYPESPGLLQENSNERDENSLAEALKVIERRKREIASSHRPYSSFNPLGKNRYRYPLYGKRSSTFDDYSDQLEPYPSYSNYLDSSYDHPLSLFRERENGPSRKLISNAHFSRNPVFNKRVSPQSTAINFPFFSEEEYQDPRVQEMLYNTLRNLRQDNHYPRVYDPKMVVAENAGIRGGDLLLLSEPERNALEKLLRSAESQYGGEAAAMIRKKRSTPSSAAPEKYEKKEVKDRSAKSSSSSPKVRTIRQKRAYRNSRVYVNPKEEDANDFLTREYFKTIARSVGEKKKKRMAFGRFKAQKRAPTSRPAPIDQILSDPEVVAYLRQKIREGEDGLGEYFLPRQELEDKFAPQSLARSDNMDRFEDFDRMSEYSIPDARQDQQRLLRRAQDLIKEVTREEEEEEEEELVREREKGKRRKGLRGKIILADQMMDGAEEAKRSHRTQRLNDDDKRSERRLFPPSFNSNTTARECAATEEILTKCLVVTEAVADESLVFLLPCLRHQVCYMCGPGMEVSRHECNALLSSALEAACKEAFENPGKTSRSLECLSAAGEVFNILGRTSRPYDEEKCSFDPCVRQLIDPR